MEQAETIESFFFEKLSRALREQRVEAEPLTEHYLVALLSAYATQPLDDAPLGVKMLSAFEAAPPERRRALREVGDTSLFVSGFWSESFARRTVDVDYYIDLGGTAYGELARVGPGWSRDPYGDVYGQLAQNFSRFVGVLAALAQWLLPATAPQDIVRLYERYRKTGSAWAARRLAAAGVTIDPDGGGRPQ
jgi:hypothetical protein